MNKCTVRIADWNWKNFALVRRVGSGCFGVFVISGLCVYDMRDAIVDLDVHCVVTTFLFVSRACIFAPRLVPVPLPVERPPRD